MAMEQSRLFRNIAFYGTIQTVPQFSGYGTVQFLQGCFVSAMLTMSVPFLVANAVSRWTKHLQH